jgi:hypothetical protein
MAAVEKERARGGRDGDDAEDDGEAVRALGAGYLRAGYVVG